ncbi:hypothetical protein ACJRO7_015804 [Eucalyptus globulus]|uniref:TIR domain-containing protein n=1 Tax=Eucalyptus globulus TaxID=34317 RepID=A0ABD3LF62_EUCGL
MANSEAGTSSESAQALEGEYRVFLSFRGPDTRHNFTDFLYHDLKEAGVHVFRDENDLREGEVIGDNLLYAINNSIIYIPIFSQNYASSKWCLRELAFMVKNVSKSEGKKCILPIFFDVEPEDVKLKTSLYSNAFLEHDKKSPKEVKDWRKALEEVDEIKGWNVKKNQSQATIVKSVVKKVLEMLEIKQRLLTENLVGLDDRVKDLTELIDVNHCDVRLIAIYGMGGIGKTTIAKFVFNQLCSHFGKYCIFLEDVRESSLTKEGIVRLQKKLLFDIAGSASADSIRDSEQGMKRIGEALRTKKVLVVLDDVAEKQQIENLIGNYSLCSGTRIIITTRDITILPNEGFNGEIRPYEVLKMDDAHACQLFCRHAFGRDFPLDDYCGPSSEIVSSTGGLPLAIEVIGSLLKGKNKEFWKEMLAKLKKEPEDEILKKLRISYDSLNYHQKQIFLDIACFFFNEEKTEAFYVWDNCSFYPEIGIHVLTSRCLIKILDNDKLWMHDQLITLGRQIVREESRYYLGKQSRLWNAEDALQIIRTEETKHEIQALEISSDGHPIEIRNEDFERLPNLRILILKCGTYVGDFAACFANLRWFSWSYPSSRRDSLDWTFRADNLYLNRLVVCKLYNINFNDDSKAWDLIKRAENLKVLSIAWCSDIMTIPNISRCLALERLTLIGCSSLKRIESFIGDLQSLIELKIIGCWKLTVLPKEVGALVKLQRFSLRDCKMLRELPNSLGNLTSLTELDLSGTMIMELPNSFVQLKSLEILRSPLCPLSAKDCDWKLPDGISTMVNLKVLDLSGHDCEIPVEIGKLSSLIILNLKYTRICGISSTINTAHHLHFLDLTDCHKIQELPELPTSLTYLYLRSTSLLSVPDLSKLTNLVNLLLSDGSDYEGKSNLISGCDLRWIGNLSRLKWLELRLLNVPAPPELTYLSQVQEIVLGLDLKPLVQLLSSNWSWRNLSTLEIDCCVVEDISLDGLSRLEDLRVSNCKWLQRLSIALELRKLQQVTLDSCRRLVEIQVVGVLKSLKNLTVDSCKSLTRISGLSYLKNLKRLEIEDCNVLTNVEGLNELDAYPIICFFGYPVELVMSQISFTIQFHLGVKRSSKGYEFIGGIKREKEGVNPYSVTYEGLVAEVKNFGFRFKRMWHKTPPALIGEIMNDSDLNRMLKYASRSGFLIPLFIEGGVDSELEGEYDEEMMEMLREERRMKTDVHSDEDEAGCWDVSCSDEDSNSASVGESETHGTSSIEEFELEPGEKDLDGVKKQVELHEEPLDEETITSKRYGEEVFPITLNKTQDGTEFDLSGSNEVPDSASVGESETDGNSSIDDLWSEPGNTECFEVMRNRTQMRDGRIGRCDSVDAGKTASIKNREKDKDEIGEPANPSDVVGSSGQTCEGVEYYEKSCKATTEVEDQRDFSSVKRDKTMEIDQVTTKTGRRSGAGCASSPGRDPIERGRGRGRASSSRNGEGLSLGRDAASTLGRGTASNSGRDIASSSQSSATSSLRRNRGSTSGKGTTLSSGRGTTLSLGMGRGSSSRTDTTKMGITSSPRRGITSSSQGSVSLSTRRGRGSTSGEGATVSSGRGMALSLGTGRGSRSRTDTTKMGTASSITSSSQSSTSLSTGSGRGSTSGKGTTASSGRGKTLSSGRGKTLSSGRGATKMGTSLRSGTNKGSSSAKAEPQTSRSLEEQ